MSLSIPLQGVLPVFQTPYFDDESIDLNTLSREIDWLFKNGANGIVMALASEILRLSTAERETLAQNACAIAGNRGPVVVSVGSESCKVSEFLARHAQHCGAAAVMAIPPVATAPDAQELGAYYRRIIRAVEIPVIVQDASGFLGRQIPLNLQAELLAEFGHSRILFKPESSPAGPQITALKNLTAGNARIFDGAGGKSLADSFQRGVIGVMPGADLIKGIVPLWQALLAGDTARAGRLSNPIAMLLGMNSSLDAFLAVEKYLLVKQGIFSSPLVRGPVAYILTEQTRLEVDRLFDLMLTQIRS